MIHAVGSPRERGRTHGTAASEIVRTAVEQLEQTVDCERFLAETSFRSAIEAHTPALLDEVDGIAEGAEASARGVLALNLMDELWWYAGADAAKCSVIAAPPVLAQTMDLPTHMDGRQLVLVNEDSRMSAATGP